MQGHRRALNERLCKFAEPSGSDIIFLERIHHNEIDLHHPKPPFTIRCGTIAVNVFQYKPEKPHAQGDYYHFNARLTVSAPRDAERRRTRNLPSLCLDKIAGTMYNENDLYKTVTGRVEGSRAPRESRTAESGLTRIL